MNGASHSIPTTQLLQILVRPIFKWVLSPPELKINPNPANCQSSLHIPTFPSSKQDGTPNSHKNYNKRIISGD